MLSAGKYPGPLPSMGGSPIAPLLGVDMTNKKCHICGEIIKEGGQGFYDRQCPDCHKIINGCIIDFWEWGKYSRCLDDEWHGYLDNGVKILEGAYDR